MVDSNFHSEKDLEILWIAMKILLSWVFSQLYSKKKKKRVKENERISDMQICRERFLKKWKIKSTAFGKQ